MKKLLLLGGSRYLQPVIEKARKLGVYTITCDYLPDNIAHRLSDEYWNISITDKEKVLEKAKKRGVSGVMSFACDPGVVTAAYIAEELGLPFQCSYEAATILQDKGKFREFLSKNGFNVPHAKRYSDPKEPYKDINYFTWPVIVKPVDSAGSKGVTKVDEPEQLAEAIDIACKCSLSGSYIIEDFIVFEGYHSSADLFTVEGKLEFVTFSDQLFDAAAENPYTPSLIIWPSTMNKDHQMTLTSELQRLMSLLEMKTGIYNVETCVGIGGIPFIMEVSPRGGGCEIAQLQDMMYGVELIENEVRKAVGLPLLDIDKKQCKEHWCEMVVHAQTQQQGVLKRIVIDSEIERNCIVHKDILAKKGDVLQPFTGANMSLGDMFLRFDTREELDNTMGNSSEWLRIELE